MTMVLPIRRAAEAIELPASAPSFTNAARYIHFCIKL
jgi:hypothetical protein